MTPEKALNLLNDMEFAEKYQGKEIYTDMLLTIKNALEKRIPQKLIHINGYKCCPVCKYLNNPKNCKELLGKEVFDLINRLQAENEEYQKHIDNELKPCPFCGREVKIQGGPEDWKPTLYDPDSGGEPYTINCECGCCFGFFDDAEELSNAWNRRVDNGNL